MRGLLRVVLSLFVLLGAAGCGDKSGGGGPGGGGGGPEGTWTIDVDAAVKAQEATSKAELDKLPPDQRAMAEGMIKSMAQMLKSMEMEVTLRPDHTVSFHTKGMGPEKNGEGTWSQTGDKVSLKATKVNGAPPTDEDKQVDLLWKDGALCVETGHGEPMPLKRK